MPACALFCAAAAPWPTDPKKPKPWAGPNVIDVFLSSRANVNVPPSGPHAPVALALNPFGDSSWLVAGAAGMGGGAGVSAGGGGRGGGQGRSRGRLGRRGDRSLRSGLGGRRRSGLRRSLRRGLARSLRRGLGRCLRRGL